MSSRIDVVLESGSTLPWANSACVTILLAHVVSLYNCMEIDH